MRACKSIVGRRCELVLMIVGDKFSPILSKNLTQIVSVGGTHGIEVMDLAFAKAR